MVDQKPLHIGIDGRNFSNLKPGGFRSYIVELISALARIDHQSQYVIYYDREYAPRENSLPDNFRSVGVTAPARVLQEQYFLPKRMNEDAMDIALFPGNLIPIRKLHCPTVVTLHDAIQIKPFLQYLRESRGLRQALINLYFAMLVPYSAKNATFIITVSNHAKSEIAARLDIPPEKILVTYNGINRQIFFPIDRGTAQEQARLKYGLPADYVMTVGSSDRRKNVQGVLKGYAHLPIQLREKHRLVVVLSNNILKPELDLLAKQLGISGSLTILQRLEPRELAVLYNAAILYITPSLYESCPLTPLEAMGCGTPLITSNVSSLPEIMGNAAIMVDPLSSQAIADALCNVLTNPGLQIELRSRSLERSALFSWETAAQKTLELFSEAHHERTSVRHLLQTAKI